MAVKKTSLFLLLAPFLLAVPALACPMCQEAAGQDPKLLEGFARSIQLMLLAPYFVFGGLVFTILRSARRKKE